MIREINERKSLYKFKKLIGRYSQGTASAIIESEGYYDMQNGGKYVEGKSEEIDLFPCAIVPLNSDDLAFDEAGTYNDDNAKMYCYKHLAKKTKIKYIKNDNRVYYYTVLKSKDYSDYDKDLQIYLIRRVSENDTDN